MFRLLRYLFKAVSYLVILIAFKIWDNISFLGVINKKILLSTPNLDSWSYPIPSLIIYINIDGSEGYLRGLMFKIDIRYCLRQTLVDRWVYPASERGNSKSLLIYHHRVLAMEFLGHGTKLRPTTQINLLKRVAALAVRRVEQQRDVFVIYELVSKKVKTGVFACCLLELEENFSSAECGSQVTFNQHGRCKKTILVLS